MIYLFCCREKENSCIEIKTLRGYQKLCWNEHHVIEDGSYLSMLKLDQNLIRFFLAQRSFCMKDSNTIRSFQCVKICPKIHLSIMDTSVFWQKNEVCKYFLVFLFSFSFFVNTMYPDFSNSQRIDKRVQ